MKNNNIYETFIAKSRYARYLDSEKRRENWPETVSRYFDAMEKHLKQKQNYILTAELRSELEAAVNNFEVMPSMRALMTSGKALDRDNTAGYNCLAGDTLVTTLEYGIVPISEVNGKSVHVVDGNGNWTLSECRSYGEQQLYTIELSSSGRGQNSVRATANHRWFLSNKSETTTSDLKIGASLATVKMADRIVADSDTADYKKGVQHGIIYGDGTARYKIHRSEKTTMVEKICKGFSIRLCGTSAPLLPYFNEYSRSFPKSFNGDPVVYISDRAIDLKSLPDVDSGFFTDNYLVGFIRGWLAADGSVTTIGGQVSLSGNKEGSDWIHKHGPRYGFVPRKSSINSRPTNFGERKHPLYSCELDRRWLEKDDFLLQYKKDRFEKIKDKNPGFGRVKSIKKDLIEKVYCFEVPTTHSFLLTKNLLTGNCSYLPVDDPKSFDEAMFILLCGTGVGFSVERQYIIKLPDVPEKIFDSESTIVVSDSKEGWAKALRQVIAMLYSGESPRWDMSKVRPAGARLKIFGGRASGPEPLVDLFKFVVKTFKAAQGRKLNSLECHDIMCKIGEVVVVGGVRRSAMISLSNLSDDRMRHAKSGAWWETQSQRALANNSSCYTERPDVGIFMKEWLSLYESKSGERGIFNREAAKNVVKMNGRRDPTFEFGTNPCSEIILRPYQFCNLTEIIVRATDTMEDLQRKARIATIMGTFQSSLTHFPYLRKIWRDNTEAERLLGVSMTGVLDNALLNNPNDKQLAERLESIKALTVTVNKEFAELLGIPQSAAITCNKPSGTVSQLTDTASGIHPRHARYYYRRVRNDIKDPLTQAMIDAGVPHEADVMKPGSTMVFTFPKKAPEGALLRSDLTALEHLKIWLIYQRHYCEHKPSVTISVSEKEWPAVGAFVWEYFDEMSGVSFLPYDGGSYKQAPYEDCTKEEYEALLAKMPVGIDWDAIVETDDNVEGAQMLACSAGGCEI